MGRMESNDNNDNNLHVFLRPLSGRRMSCPVYEEQVLGHFPRAAACAGLPFPLPARPADHQVLVPWGVVLLWVGF